MRLLKFDSAGSFGMSTQLPGRCRTSSRGRRSEARCPRFCRRTAMRRGAGRGWRSDRPCPSCRGSRSAARRAASPGPVGVRTRQLRGQHRRDPVLAHQVAHRRPGADPGQSLVLRLSHHPRLIPVARIREAKARDTRLTWQAPQGQRCGPWCQCVRWCSQARPPHGGTAVVLASSRHPLVFPSR